MSVRASRAHANRRRVSAAPRRSLAQAVAQTLSLRNLRAVATLALWGATLWGVVWGLRFLEPRALAALNDGRWRIEWVAPPTWFDRVRDIIEADLSPKLDMMDGVDLQNGYLAQELHRDLASSPWIAAVRSVRKRADGLVLVDAEFRKPFTRIEYRGATYLVDQKGYMLPRIDRAEVRGADASIYLEGVARPPPAVGQQWPGADVQAGLSTIAFLYEHAYASLLPHLLAVHVGNYNGKVLPLAGRVRIRALGNQFIEWGWPPGEEYGSEATAVEKFAKLSVFFQEHGRLPAGADLRYQDRNTIFTKPATRPGAPVAAEPGRG